MIQQCYIFGPTTLAVTFATAQQYAHLHTLWQQLFQLYPTTVAGATPLQLTLTVAPPPVPAAAMVKLFCYGAIQVCQSVDEAGLHFGLYCGDTWLFLDLDQGVAAGRITGDFAGYRLAEQREFFQLLFFLLLRRQGYYVLHANAVLPPLQDQAEPAAGVLLVGDCGAGKTTLTLSLLQAGWRCVGDDLVILAVDPAGFVVAHGLRRGFSCTPETAAAFPLLHTRLAEGPDLVRNKKLIEVERSYPTQFVNHCRPRLLLFPTIAQQPHSQVAPISAPMAIHLLLSQPRAGILVDPPTVAGHFQIYGKLVSQTTSAQLLAGQDVLTAPAAVSDLLATCRALSKQ